MIKNMPGPIARKWPLAIRLVELLHTQPDVWAPYKELFLPERIQTEFTMTPEEVRHRLKLAPFRVDFGVYEKRWEFTRAVFSEGLQAVHRLARLTLPGTETTPEELTWAFSVVQSRAVNRRGLAELIPLFDMLNHAPGPACDFSAVTTQLAAPIRAAMATDADPARLQVRCTGDGQAPTHLFRGGRLLGHLDDCVVLLAPARGLRAGEEACFRYHEAAGLSEDERLGFLMQYGFYPEDSTPR